MITLLLAVVAVPMASPIQADLPSQTHVSARVSFLLAIKPKMTAAQIKALLPSTREFAQPEWVSNEAHGQGYVSFMNQPFIGHVFTATRKQMEYGVSSGPLSGLEDNPVPKYSRNDPFVRVEVLLDMGIVKSKQSGKDRIDMVSAAVGNPPKYIKFDPESSGESYPHWIAHWDRGDLRMTYIEDRFFLHPKLPNRWESRPFLWLTHREYWR